MKNGLPIQVGIRCGDLRFTVPMAFYRCEKSGPLARLRTPFDVNQSLHAVHNSTGSD